MVAAKLIVVKDLGELNDDFNRNACAFFFQKSTQTSTILLEDLYNLEHSNAVACPGVVILSQVYQHAQSISIGTVDNESVVFAKTYYN